MPRVSVQAPPLCAQVSGTMRPVLRPAPRTEWVITTDAFLENVQFPKGEFIRQKAIGYKALARATSDIAAMARGRVISC